MKRFFSFVVALTCALVSYAQSEMVATLSHGDSISVFYGSEGLKAAYDKSTHGDVITLSAGVFKAVDIAKNITVRGVGIDMEERISTVIDGDFRLISVPDSVDAGHFTLESIYHDGPIIYGGDEQGGVGAVKNAHFIKCRLGSITNYLGYADNDLINALFLQCRIVSKIYMCTNSSARLFNCVVFSPSQYANASTHFEFTNCLISGHIYNLDCAVFKNCILRETISASYKIPSSCLVKNCVAITDSKDYFESLYPQNKYAVVSQEDIDTIFKTFTGKYSDTETFELTDEAKEKYVGTDNKEVGIYGGSFPFTTVSSLPKITKFNVASKSDEEGKLSVEIEVSGVQ